MCKSAILEAIEKHSFVLTLGRYVGIPDEEDDGIPFVDKMNDLTATIAQQIAKEKSLDEQLKEQLGKVEFLGIWEQLNNPNFNRVEFEAVKNEAGSNAFVMTPKKWGELTGAIGVVSKSGRYGGTYADKDIAFEFASWVSVEFKLYLIKEFQRLKEQEQKQLGWDIRRNLAKINYRIHTDAIKENLIPATLSKQQISHIYATEADILNMALFGKTAKQWRDDNPDQNGNIRDYANVSQLVCLSNLENLNAVFINEGLEEPERLTRLNQIAISQMRILLEGRVVGRLGNE